MIEILPEEIRLAETIAKSVGRHWRNVETDDVIGHLYLWLVENRYWLDLWRNDPGGEAMLFASLRRAAAKFCAKEEAARINRPLNASPTYPVDVIERALPFIFQEWPATEVAVNPVTGAPLYHPAQIGEAMAILADISGAFYGLPKDTQELLALRFRDDLKLDQIGELRGITGDGARRQIVKALEYLSQTLGSD